MRFSDYLKHALWDFVLVFACSMALGYTALNGFYVDQALQHSPVPALVTAVEVLLLFGIGFKKKLLLPGGIAYGVLAVAACVVAAASSADAGLTDTEGNNLIFMLCLLVTGTVPYLLSRTRAGSAVLLIAGVFTCGWIQFFYQFDELAWALVFLCCALALIVYKNYQLSARTATSLRHIAFALGFAMALAAVAVAVGISALLWFAVIAPLNPGVLDVKLVTEYRALETVQVHGTSSEYLTPNLETTSNQTNDGSRTTDDLQRGEDGEPMPAQAEANSTQENLSAGTFLGIDIDSVQESFDFQANPLRALLTWLLALLPLLLIAAYFVGRRVWRERRLRKVQQLPPSQQVRTLFLFLSGRLARVGFKIPNGQTPLEFARNNHESMERFDAAAGEDYRELTACYAAVAYGAEEATQEDADRFAAYYRGFWKAAREQLGNWAYLWRSLRL